MFDKKRRPKMLKTPEDNWKKKLCVPAHIHVQEGLQDNIFYDCTGCKKSFNTYQKVKQHEFCLNSNPQPLTCDQCGVNVSSCRHLNYHSLSHMGLANVSEQSPFKCLETGCGSPGFRSLGMLNHHMLTHSGEIPHACSVCPRTFTSLSALRQHMLVHVRPQSSSYVCPFCKRPFLKMSALRSHIVVHMGRDSKGESLINPRQETKEDNKRNNNGSNNLIGASMQPEEPNQANQGNNYSNFGVQSLSNPLEQPNNGNNQNFIVELMQPNEQPTITCTNLNVSSESLLNPLEQNNTNNNQSFVVGPLQPHQPCSVIYLVYRPSLQVHQQF